MPSDTSVKIYAITRWTSGRFLGEGKQNKASLRPTKMWKQRKNIQKIKRTRKEPNQPSDLTSCLYLTPLGLVLLTSQIWFSDGTSISAPSSHCRLSIAFWEVICVIIILCILSFWIRSFWLWHILLSQHIVLYR